MAMSMATLREYVRICPVCGVAAPPELALCSQCGTLLLGVDLSLKPEIAPVAQPVTEAPRTLPVAAETATPATRDTGILRCLYADCGAPNPPGSARCLYCDRPFDTPPETGAAVPENGFPPVTPSFYRLPAALADKFHIVEVLPAGGAEAEIMVLAGTTSDVKVIAKLYRPGIVPKTDVLDRISQAAFRHVVHLIAHGVSDGIGYELMEYCPAGSLRTLMEESPQPRNRLRLIVEELAEALAALHDLNIIHRDLKPENVLIRRLDPLDLVLTDFGIASVADATQRFTGLARTVKYGAPETLSGVLDRATDYWSLGMILVELLTGRHPFDGLSDAVITHRLITSGVDLSAITERDWGALCQGLLLRNPRRRWGIAEIRRWLDGDVTLPVPQDEVPPPQAYPMRPYHLEDIVCHTPVELAVALAMHWQAGRKDLMRGQITAWAAQDLKDQNLVRLLQDLLDTRGISDDLRLLRLIRHLAPDLPPVWRGESLAIANLLAMAARASGEEAHAAHWLVSVYAEKVLRQLPAADYPAETALVARWETGYDHCMDLWHATTNARTNLRKEQTSIGGITDFDALVYGEPQGITPPEPAYLLPLLLLVLADDAHAEQFRTRIRLAAATWLPHNPWIERLLDDSDVVGWVVADALLPYAQHAAEDAQLRQKRDADAKTAQRDGFVSRTNNALTLLRETCELSLFSGAFNRGVTSSNNQALLALVEEARAAGLDATTPLMRTLASAEPIALRIQDRLDAWEHAARINALWRNPELLQGIGGFLFLLFIFGYESLPAHLPLWILLILGSIVGWRLSGLASFRNTIRDLGKVLPPRVPTALVPPARTARQP